MRQRLRGVAAKACQTKRSARVMSALAELVNPSMARAVSVLANKAWASTDCGSSVNARSYNLIASA